MHERGLADELMPQLQQIARTNGFQRVTRVEMTVGTLHGVSGESLQHSFEEVFEGGNFGGARMSVTIVAPGEEFHIPGRSDAGTANGWEILVTNMEGEQ